MDGGGAHRVVRLGEELAKTFRPKLRNAERAITAPRRVAIASQPWRNRDAIHALAAPVPSR